MSTPARKRLMRDFKRLQQDPPAGISGAPHDNNIMLWNAVIFGPDDTPWDGAKPSLSKKLVMPMSFGQCLDYRHQLARPSEIWRAQFILRQRAGEVAGGENVRQKVGGQIERFPDHIQSPLYKSEQHRSPHFSPSPPLFPLRQIEQELDKGSAGCALAGGRPSEQQVATLPLLNLLLANHRAQPSRSGMGKRVIVKSEEDYSSREKYITWSDEATKFMLEWYIDLRKDKPATFKFKKQHHLQCADAVNAKFALGATQNQVDRHYRSYKEKWGWVRRAMGNSGNGFDATSCKFTLSESEKAKLSKTAVNYLTRPIRFFHLLEELFSDQSQADGSLAADQTTVNVGDDSDDDGVKEIEGYTLAGNSDEDADSDTIARLSPKTDLDGKPSSKKRKREKSPSKKPTKGKVSNSDMAAGIVMLANSLANPPPVPPPVPVQPVVAADPYANLWNRINALTITAKDRLAIVAYLSSPSQEVFRSYLNSSPDSMLNEWVISFFDHQQGGTQGSGGAF